MLNTIQRVLKVREPDINRVSDKDGIAATIIPSYHSVVAFTWMAKT